VSLMQPAAPEGPGRPAPAPESLAAVAEADVEPSEVFFHKYFALAAQKAAKQGRASNAARADGESDDSEADIGTLPASLLAACSNSAAAHGHAVESGSCQHGGRHGWTAALAAM